MEGLPNELAGMTATPGELSFLSSLSSAFAW